MKRLLLLALIIVIYANLAWPQVPNPEHWQIIYGNRDGSPMSVTLGATIEFPVWGATDPNDLVDSVTFMHNPLESYDIAVPQRLGGGCTRPIECPDTCGFTEPVHNGMYTNQSMTFYGYLHDPRLPQCFFWTGGDTVQIGYFTMTLSGDSSLMGQTICPYRQGADPANGGLLWGMQDGMTGVVPVETYGCLYFSTCDAVAGDANGDGIFNGLDVGYGVNYLKGIGDPPAACNCRGNIQIYTGGDANGNCIYNGIDITYSINYLKGIGPAPVRCPDC